MVLLAIVMNQDIYTGFSPKKKEVRLGDTVTFYTRNGKKEKGMITMIRQTPTGLLLCEIFADTGVFTDIPMQFCKLA